MYTWDEEEPTRNWGAPSVVNCIPIHWLSCIHRFRCRSSSSRSYTLIGNPLMRLRRCSRNELFQTVWFESIRLVYHPFTTYRYIQRVGNLQIVNKRSVVRQGRRRPWYADQWLWMDSEPRFPVFKHTLSVSSIQDRPPFSTVYYNLLHDMIKVDAQFCR
jgi:hypothetical protein